MIRVIAKRYAKALVEIVEAQNITEKVRNDLVAFIGVMNEQPVVERLFKNPAVTPKDKVAVIHEIALRLGLHAVTIRFIEFLAGNNRVRYIREMQQAFEELLAERQNRVAVELISASPLNNGFISDIKNRLEAVTGKNIDISARLDQSLIGGARVRIGSVIYDGSIKNQLERLREQLAK